MGNCIGRVASKKQTYHYSTKSLEYKKCTKSLQSSKAQVDMKLYEKREASDAQVHWVGRVVRKGWCRCCWYRCR